MQKKGKAIRVQRGSCALAPEPLEPRMMLSTYTVNTLSDSATPASGLLTSRVPHGRAGH